MTFDDINVMPNSETKNKKALAQERLCNLISRGDFSPGDKLPPERELAVALNVSRNILREAIVSLSLLGILEVRERQGTFIKNLNNYDHFETLQNIQMMPADFITYQIELRLIVSVPAAELAALRRTDDDIQKLWDCYNNFMKCPYSTLEEQRQNGKWEGLLHSLVTEAAHNPILSRVYESINSLVEKNNDLVHPYILSESGWIEHIQTQHYKIIKAIEEQDHVTAGGIQKIHLLESFEKMKKTYPYPIQDTPYMYWTLK